MANIILPAGGGGGAVILRAEGQAGNHVKATLGSKLVEGTIPEGGALQLRLPGLGLWEVETEAADSMYRFSQEVKVYRYGITPCWAVAKKLFADCSPDEIQFVARAGLAKDFWKIGDRHKVTMMDDEEIYLQIYDFDHDVGTDGETVLPLTLGMENCFKTILPMADTNTNVGGWMSCKVRQINLPSIKETFPDEWQRIMTTCRKFTSNGNQNPAITQTDDDLFLFSEVELFGSTTFSFAGEGKVYPIFSDNESRLKRANGIVAQWWERSPCRNNATQFCNVNGNGDAVATNANVTSAASLIPSRFGVALGFCVG